MWVCGDDVMFSEWGEAEWVRDKCGSTDRQPEGSRCWYVVGRCTRQEMLYLHGVFACGIVEYGTLAASGVLFSEGIIVFAQVTARLSEDARRIVEKCIQFCKEKTKLVQNPLADGRRKCTGHTRP